jgi:hypothetical protein
LLVEVRRVVTDPPAGLDAEVGAFLDSLEERRLIERGDAHD